MVEIALCLAIIGFALVAIIGVLPVGLSVQKDNRAETIINFEAAYLMDVLRNGPVGQDNLTNYVTSISIYSTLYSGGSPVVLPVATYSNLSPNPSPVLYSGSNIVGLLSTPKYTREFSAQDPTGTNSFLSNYVTADFRSMTSTLLNQSAYQPGSDLSFRYRLAPEIVPSLTLGAPWTNFLAAGASGADKIQRSSNYFAALALPGNLVQMRLRFNWPLMPNGLSGPNRQIFRGMVSGSIQNTNVAFPALKENIPFYYIQPQVYSLLQ